MAALPRRRNAVRTAYKTRRGVMYCGSAEVLKSSRLARKYRRKVQLIFTSPPFPLNRKKKYGNLRGEAYVEWFASFAPIFRRLLKKNGSVVVELGNAWEPGEPVMSTLALRALLAFLDKGQFHLCQEFVCYNPARLPSPAQWVNIERIRVKDAYTRLWWMSMTPRPKADNRRVLKPYSAAMLKLLATQRYNGGKRPSQHDIGLTSFLRNNGGAIPSNVITLTNTNNTDQYLMYCRDRGHPLHPARMAVGFDCGPPTLQAFCCGSGCVAAGKRVENHEPRADYIVGSRGRFRRRPVSANGHR